MVLLAGLVLSGRLWPQPPPSHPSIDQAQVEKLEARPMVLPAVAVGAECPTLPVSEHPNLGLGIGSGPVWLYSTDSPAITPWGGWAIYKFVYQTPSAGPVLMRGKNLETHQLVAFAQNPLGPSAMGPAGAALGTDQVSGQTLRARSEALFQDYAHTTPINSQGERAPYTIMVGVQGGPSGCVGFQLDGPGFTETIVVQWFPGGL